MLHARAAPHVPTAAAGRLFSVGSPCSCYAVTRSRRDGSIALSSAGDRLYTLGAAAVCLLHLQGHSIC